MARRRTMRRVTRTVIINRRGRSAADTSSPGGPVGVTGVCYVASVPGGKADLALSVVNGTVQALTPVAGRSLEAMDYTVGDVPDLAGGHGWAGPGAVATPFAQRVSQQTFDTCALGGVSATGLADGSGWSSAGSVSVPHVRRVGEELFEAYPTGPVASGSVTGGSGWAGGAVLFAW